MEDLGKLVYLSSGYLAKSFKKPQELHSGNYRSTAGSILRKKLLMSGDYSGFSGGKPLRLWIPAYLFFKDIQKTKPACLPRNTKNSFSLTNSKRVIIHFVATFTAMNSERKISVHS